MVIRPNDLGGDEPVARRVLVRARDIAPCIDTFEPDSELWKDAIAILQGVIAELPKSGSRRTRSLGRNGTTMSFEIARAFSDDDIDALKSLCPKGPPPGLPIGSFPDAGFVSGLWPEGFGS